MSLDNVPLIEATNDPFLPFPFLLVTNVYSSPYDSDTSSMLSCSPMFSVNSI
jgi:hypothetical protein